MSRRFLTPVGLPSGATLPSVGSAGDLFYKLDEQAIYVHNGSSWVASQGSGASALSELTDATLTDPINGQTLIYDGSTSKWVNVNFIDMLANFGLITGDGGSYNTTDFTGTIDGGLHNTTLFVSVYDGGNESSF